MEAAPEETRGEPRGRGRREGCCGPGAEASTPPSRGNPDLTRSPTLLSALYREYRSLKKVLGQAGGVEPHSSGQSSPAAAEQVPGLDIATSGSTSCVPEPEES